MDEHELWLRSIADQRAAFRAAVSGLTEEQARAVPSASALSLAVLVKHAVWGEDTWVGARVGGGVPDEGPAGWVAGFELTPEDTVASLLARWDVVAGRTEQVVRAEPDLGRPVPLSAETRQYVAADVEPTVRWVLLHLVEELARHAGHADVVRETVDGKGAQELAQP
ncbi:DinB family protein [Klenkia terrae]|uniref:DinB family protein n=1 Tax=Klenkia terrae TaxID=1052259 RepID=UPI001CD8C3A9|nr:DinB family protein [Klenkia terrae]